PRILCEFGYGDTVELAKSPTRQRLGVGRMPPRFSWLAEAATQTEVVATRGEKRSVVASAGSCSSRGGPRQESLPKSRWQKEKRAGTLGVCSIQLANMPRWPPAQRSWKAEGRRGKLSVKG